MNCPIEVSIKVLLSKTGCERYSRPAEESKLK
jgi:hypothetical protein